MEKVCTLKWSGQSLLKCPGFPQQKQDAEGVPSYMLSQCLVWGWSADREDTREQQPDGRCCWSSVDRPEGFFCGSVLVHHVGHLVPLIRVGVRVVLPKFGSKPKFEPEPLGPNSKFSSRFRIFAELNLRSSSMFSQS